MTTKVSTRSVVVSLHQSGLQRGYMSRLNWKHKKNPIQSADDHAYVWLNFYSQALTVEGTDVQLTDPSDEANVSMLVCECLRH